MIYKKQSIDQKLMPLRKDLTEMGSEIALLKEKLQDGEAWRRPAYTILQFCDLYSVHESTYHRWRLAGKTPKISTVGGRRYITEKARKHWQDTVMGDLGYD